MPLRACADAMGCDARAHLFPQSVLEQLKALFTGLDPLPPGKISPTVGLNIGRMQVDRTKLIFWDLGGSKALRSLWEKYYAEAHGLLYVVDASDPARFDESRDVLRQLRNNPDLAGIPLLVFANKQVRAMPGARMLRSTRPPTWMTARAMPPYGVRRGAIIGFCSAAIRALASTHALNVCNAVKCATPSSAQRASRRAAGRTERSNASRGDGAIRPAAGPELLTTPERRRCGSALRRGH